MSYPEKIQPEYPPWQSACPPGPLGQPQPYGDNLATYPQRTGYPHPAAQYACASQQPIVQQPGLGLGQFAPVCGDGWMAPPQQIPANVPPGLQYLTTIDKLFVKQKVELLEAFIGFETNNKYSVKNGQGQKVYYAVEDNDCCTRMCCGTIRPFDLKILDNYKNEVIHLRRDLRCQSCWCPCCLQKLEVFSPPGNLVGTVEQTWSLFTPEFDVKNESGNVVLRIRGPVCRFSICSDVEFEVLSRDESTVVGKISKQWSGLARELFTDADNFGISFPLDLDVRMKAVMMGACFLIDFMYFEKTGNEESDGIGLC